MSFDVVLSGEPSKKNTSAEKCLAESSPDHGLLTETTVYTEIQPHKPATVIPPRKISNRFINTFSQLYTTDDPDRLSPSPSTRASGSAHPSEESVPEIKGKVESKLLSIWNNVKFGWSGKIRGSFSKEQPVWLLGYCYHKRYSPNPSMETSLELPTTLDNRMQYVSDLSCVETGSALGVQELATDAYEGDYSENSWEDGIEGFKKDFISRLWMTYRREFPILNGSNYTSDCGWGCMLRSGQMLLAQALLFHFLGRKWRWDPDSQLILPEDALHRKIIRWFGDMASKNSPFSIHTLVTLGQNSGKKPGDWYGPASVSHLLRQALEQAAQENADLDGLTVYVAQDCTVYIQDILDECLIPNKPIGPVAPWRKKVEVPSEDNQDGMHWKALILLVPLRLGTDKLNSTYANSLKAMLANEHCIGIIGGRPKHSLFFVGYQEDKLIHLDPHYCQEMVDVNQENFSLASFHCNSPRKMKLSKMDPSCCIGFYCQTRNDFDAFVVGVQPFLLTTKSQQPDRTPSRSPHYVPEPNYPMFVFSRGRSTDHQTSIPRYEPPPPSSYGPKSYPTEDDDDDEDDEFVML